MRYISLIFLFLTAITLKGQVQFENYFHDKSLRLDYYHSGDSESEHYAIDELIEEPWWGGSKTNLIDTFNFGAYCFRVYDLKSDSLIYSRGYSTLFGEWQTIAEAKETKRSFSESLIFPFPKADVRVEFLSRDESGSFTKKFEYTVNVDSYFIRPGRNMEYPVYDAYISGDPSEKVDIVILPDGYTEEELDLFKEDCEKFANYLFSFKPYDQNRNKFNIYGVLAPSGESGVDKPGDSVWKKTILNSSFYTFDSERYCMTMDNKSMRDLAANAPYDQIYILANDPKYGGGGIFNQYCLSVNSNLAAAKIIIHEFGHGFAGLGDEYYNSEVAYSEFYPTDIEPWEPNITTLVDFDSKWKHLLADSIPVPTPPLPRYMNSLGVFEGGGYVAKGVYRPRYDCLMNTFNGDSFCGACREAIQKMIDFYCD